MTLQNANVVIKPFATEPGRGRKACPKCPIYVGVQTKECPSCGHMFAPTAPKGSKVNASAPKKEKNNNGFEMDMKALSSTSAIPMEILSPSIPTLSEIQSPEKQVIEVPKSVMSKIEELKQQSPVGQEDKWEIVL